MQIESNLDRYHQISVLSPKQSSKKNSDALEAINKFYNFYGIEMTPVDSTLILDSFKGDNRFFYGEYSGNVDDGEVSIVHDVFYRKILFFQNNMKVHEVTLDNMEITVYRSLIPLAFIKLCNFYFPKRIITSTYTTKNIFNPDFPISGDPNAILITTANPDIKDISLVYAKTINAMVDGYIISPEIISYSKNDKSENIIDIFTKWIDDMYIKLELENNSITIIDATGSKKKIRL